LTAINIENTVRQFRLQRDGMVQTQVFIYLFIYFIADPVPHFKNFQPFLSLISNLFCLKKCEFHSTDNFLCIGPHRNNIGSAMRLFWMSSMTMSLLNNSIDISFCISCFMYGQKSSILFPSTPPDTNPELSLANLLLFESVVSLSVLVLLISSSLNHLWIDAAATIDFSSFKLGATEIGYCQQLVSQLCCLVCCCNPIEKKLGAIEE
jgi:hypothetical protein